MARDITKDFFNALKKGFLKPILNRILEDDTLNLEFRKQSNKKQDVCIYYRGRRLGIITYKTKPYELLDIKTCYQNISYKKSPIAFLDEIVKIKDDIDRRVKPPLGSKIKSNNLKEELEYSQKFEKTNNKSASDYYIIDLEHNTDDKKIRFDAIGIKWNSQSEIADTLSFIEVKNGSNAVSGSDATVSKHIEDYISYIKSSTLNNTYKDMENIFWNKINLKLIRRHSFMKKENLKISKNEFLLVLANYNPNKTDLYNEICDVINNPKLNKSLDNVYITIATYMGEDLYFDSFIKFVDFYYQLKKIYDPKS